MQKLLCCPWSNIYIYIFPMALWPNAGLGVLIHEVSR